MTKIVITGGYGQVGWCLTNKAKNFGFNEVVSVDRDKLDITDEQAVMNFITAEKPDVVVNAAAYTAVDKAESDGDLARKLNAYGPAYIAKACKKNNALFLHISTDYVFNGEKEGLYKEDDAYAPLGVYGETKREGEELALKECPSTVILRTAWVFCEHGNNFIKTMLRLGQNRDKIGVVSDQYGAPTYAGDIAEALLTIGSKFVQNKNFNDFGIYHFTGFPYVNWHEFAEAIFTEARLQGILNKELTVNAIKTEDYPTPAKRPANSRLCLNKIKNTFGIEPSNWQQALKNLKLYLPEQ